MLRYIYIGILTLCLPLAGWAQLGTWYSTRLLSQLGEAAQLSLTAPQVDTSYVVGYYKNYPIVAEWQSGIVTHLGIKLFEPELKQSTNKPLCDFVERYTLEELTCEDKDELKLKHFEDGVSKDGNLNAIFNRDGVLLRFNTPTTGHYELCWEDNEGNRLYGINLPANWSLISGEDKTELESNLHRRIREYTVTEKKPKAPKASRLEKTNTRDVYVYKRGHYIIPQMASALYFLKEGEEENPEYNLIINSKYAAESLNNILSSPAVAKSYTVEITQKMYGFRETVYTLNMGQLLGYCMNEGCRPYIGIEQIDEMQIVATLLLVNPEWGYNHIMQITMNRKQIGLPNGKMKATINAYTPTHNLEALYDDERQMRKPTGRTPQILIK